MQNEQRAHRNLTLSFGNFGRDITKKVNKHTATLQNMQSRNLSDASERLQLPSFQPDCKQTQNLPPQDNMMTFRGSRKEGSSEKMTFGIQFSPSQKGKGKSSQRQDASYKLTNSQMQLLNFKDYLSGSMKEASSTKSLVTSKYIQAKEYHILPEEQCAQTKGYQKHYTFNSEDMKGHGSTVKSMTQVLPNEHNILALAPQHPTKGNSLVSVTNMKGGQSHGSEQFCLNGLSQSQKSKGSRISHVTIQSGKDEGQMSQIDENEIESVIPTEGGASVSNKVQSLAQNQQLNQNSGYFGQDYHREFAENPSQFEVYNNLQQISSLEISQISKQSGQTYNGHLSQLKMFSPSYQLQQNQENVGLIKFVAQSPQYLNDPEENVVPTNSSKIESEDFNEFGTLSYLQNENFTEKQQNAFQDASNYLSQPQVDISKQSPLALSQYQMVEKSNERMTSGISECKQYMIVDNSNMMRSSQSFVDRSYLKNIQSNQHVPIDLSMADTQRSITENLNKPPYFQNHFDKHGDNKTTEMYSSNISPDEVAQVQPQSFQQNTKVINDVIDNGFQAQENSTENMTLGRISYSNRHDSQNCNAACFPNYDKHQVTCKHPPQAVKKQKSEQTRNVRQQLELQQELQASPSRVISDDQQMFHSHHSIEGTEQINPMNTDQNSMQQVQNQNDLSSYNIMSNIFYKAFENTQHQNEFEIRYLDRTIKIQYQLLCFNSIQAMEAQVQQYHQQSIDSNKTKQICMEILEINSGYNGIDDKKRRMFYLNILPKIKITEFNTKRVEQINQICGKFQNSGFECFEQVYNMLNEQFINEIIDTECERQSKKVDGDQMNFLLISEENMETRDTKRGEENVVQGIQSQKTSNRSEIVKQQSETHNKMPIHEMLYRESELKEKEKRIRSKEREVQKLQDEIKECSFSPQPFQGSGSQRIHPGSGNGSERHVKGNSQDQSLKGKTLKFGQIGSGDKQACTVRSPEKFYNDMMEFKYNKEGKLEKIRNEEAMNLQIATFGGGTLRSSIEQRTGNRKINVTSQKKDESSQAKACVMSKSINMKELAQKHSLTVQNKGFSKTITSPIMPISMFKKQDSSRSFTSPKSLDSKVTLNNNEDIPLSNSKVRLSSHKVRSTKNVMAISEHLYKDAFKRDTKREQLKSQYDEEQKRLNQQSSKAAYVKSLNILANKIALRTKETYDQIVDDFITQFNIQQQLSLSKGRINTISEKSQESENVDWTPRATMIDTQQKNSISKDDIEGITFEQFIQLMQKLKYMSGAGEDIRNINKEMACIDNAWMLLSHQEIGHPHRGKVVSLRNLIIFLIAIENLFIDSMGLSDPSLLPQANMFSREERETGFFLGTNYFLDDQNDSRKLANIYSLFAKNRANFDKYQTRQRKSQERSKSQNQSKSRSCERQDGRIPPINKKSDQIMRQKLKEFYSRRVVKDIGSGKITTFKGQAPAGMQKLGSKYEDFLIHKGNQTKIKIQEKVKQQEREATKGCTFMPKINKNYKSRSLQSHSHRGYHDHESIEDSMFDHQNDYLRGRSISTKNQNRINITKNLTKSNFSKSQVLKQQNVFENLYKVAEKRQESTLEAKKNSRIIQLEKLRKECTFRPNLIKTQSMNKQVDSRLYCYSYKDPEILKEQFNNTQQIDFKALNLKSNRTQQAFLSNSVGQNTFRGSSGIRTNIPGTARGYTNHEQDFLNTQKIEISKRLQQNNQLKQKKQKINKSLAQKFIVQKNIQKHYEFPSSRNDPSTLRGNDQQISTNNDHSVSLKLQTHRDDPSLQELSTISQVAIPQTNESHENSQTSASNLVKQYQKQFSVKSLGSSASSKNGSQQRISRNGSQQKSNGSKKNIKRYDNFEQAERHTLPMLFAGQKKSITDTLCTIKNPQEVIISPSDQIRKAYSGERKSDEVAHEKQGTESGQTTWVQVSGPDSQVSQKQCRVDQPKVINQPKIYQQRYELTVDEFEQDIIDLDEQRITPGNCTPNSNLRSEDTPIKIEDFNPLLTGPCTYPLQLQKGLESQYQ